MSYDTHTKFLIGYLVLSEGTVFTQSYETAAWYMHIEVPAGRYPVYGYSRNIDYERTSDRIYNYTCKLEGTVIGSDFTSLLCGNRVGAGKVDEHKGERATYTIDGSGRGYALAHAILKGESNIELLPEYEARHVDFVGIDGKPGRTAGIFKK